MVVSTPVPTTSLCPGYGTAKIHSVVLRIAFAKACRSFAKYYASRNRVTPRGHDSTPTDAREHRRVHGRSSQHSPLVSLAGTKSASTPALIDLPNPETPLLGMRVQGVLIHMRSSNRSEEQTSELQPHSFISYA